MRTMRSMSGIEWTILSLLLLWKRSAAQREEGWCSEAGPAGTLHPVQGLQETFEAGPGCAARGGGDRETHVVAVGRVTNPQKKVTVLLKPLSLTPSPLRSLRLLLSSQLPVSWWLEADRLPANLTVLVQVSSNSSARSRTLRLRVHGVHLLPFRPRALHRWALRHHGNLSSLTHTSHGNRVYLRLGEDPTLPAVCQLQSTFLSHNYLTSDLQAQEVQGCFRPPPSWGVSPEVHVIKLHSAGSGLCGSLQVEVIVSLLVPPSDKSKTQNVVLILSSSVPVNWAVTARGVQGHVSVHSSNSVSPPYPPERGLTLSSTLNSDLCTVSDVLLWARQSGYAEVTSFTEADLANRFVIQLVGGRTGVPLEMNPLAVKPSWAEERRLRQWLNAGGPAGGGRDSFAVQCEDGRLSASVDRHILQTLSVPVAAVTLRDPTCQAESNGSHFLLVFPVISCGTEGLLLEQPRGVQYKNMMLLWRDEPQTILALNETERKSKSPLGIHFSCLAAVPSFSGPATDGVKESGLVPWAPRGPGPDPGLSLHPATMGKSGPQLILRLFVTEDYEQRRIGPCVITAGHRVYVEISSKGLLPDVVEVKSCVVSPLSDPKKSPSWTVIRDGCSSDPSLTLSADTKEEKEEEEEEEEEEKEEEEVEEEERMENGRRGAPVRMARSSRSTGSEEVEEEEEEARPLRFSFILKPLHNESVQFLHCSLHMCDSLTPNQPVEETECEGGLRIPPLISRAPKHQCEVRNLTRPMVVTHSLSSLAPKLPRPPVGQRTKRLSVSPPASPDPEHSNSVAETGAVMGIVFAAFVLGVGLMGGLWCIYNYTAVARPTLLGENGPLKAQSHDARHIWNPASVSDHSSSSV